MRILRVTPLIIDFSFLLVKSRAVMIFNDRSEIIIWYQRGKCFCCICNVININDKERGSRIDPCDTPYSMNLDDISLIKLTYFTISNHDAYLLYKLMT